MVWDGTQKGPPAGGVFYANQAYSATGWVFVGSAAATDTAAPLSGGMDIAGTSLVVPATGWYAVTGSFNLTAGSAGTVARRGISVGTSNAGPVNGEPQLLVSVANNNLGALTVAAPMYLTANQPLYIAAFTDVVNHYALISQARVRAVLLG